MSSKRIENMQDLCNYFSADEPASLNRNIYNATSCGMSITVYLPKRDEEEDALLDAGYVITYSSGHIPNVEPIHNEDERWKTLSLDTPIHSFSVQTMVEGSDAEFQEVFTLPVDASEVEKCMDNIECEAEAAWEEANGEEDELCTL